MANKPRGKPFAKGNQLAKGLEIAPEIYEGRRLTRVVYEATLHKYLHMGRDELKEVLNNKDTKAIDLLIVSILHKGIVSGDTRRAEFLVARLVSPTPTKSVVEFTDKTEDAKIKEMAIKLLEIAKEPDEDDGEK